MVGQLGNSRSGQTLPQNTWNGDEFGSGWNGGSVRPAITGSDNYGHQPVASVMGPDTKGATGWGPGLVGIGFSGQGGVLQ